LLSEPKHGGCCRLAEILENVSHDSVNRFLPRERYEPKDLFNTVKEIINIVGGILSVDDTVVEKLYSDPKNAELIGYFWSGKHHKAIKGINLITLYYSDVHGNSGLAHLIFKMLVGQMFQVLLSFVSKKENPFPTRYLGFR